MQKSKMTPTWLSPDEITPYENNPRINGGAIAAVQESIRKYGFNSPILVDENKIIICGHTRYRAAKELGLQEIPVVIADWLDENQVKEYRIVDNKTSELATWDDELLKIELEGTTIDLSLFGFEEFVGDVEFEDIPDGIDLLKQEQDGEKVSLHYLTFGSKRVPLTEEELAQLEERYEAYTASSGVYFGFASSLLNGDSL